LITSRAASCSLRSTKNGEARERKPQQRNRPWEGHAYVHRRQEGEGRILRQAGGLTNLDDGNLKMTTDFRSIYATMLKEWMGFDDMKAVLKAEYPVLGVFA
jgi:hypothetical protein